MSGVGETADWDARVAAGAHARSWCSRADLNATNVADAIAQVRPFGVDVSSGVERRRAIKDPAKIHEFVRAHARQRMEQDR